MNFNVHFQQAHRTKKKTGCYYFLTILSIQRKYHCPVCYSRCNGSFVVQLIIEKDILTNHWQTQGAHP